MSSEYAFRWDGHVLVEIGLDEAALGSLDAADSLLVSEGHALALDLHRSRFHYAVNRMVTSTTTISADDVGSFLRAAFAKVPMSGQWFPRVELRTQTDRSQLIFRQRSAPALTKAVTLGTHSGKDPRHIPSVKGPDLEALGAIRVDAHQRGIDDVVFVTANDHIIDGAANALVWWRGETLCAPPRPENDPDFARVASVTSQALLGVAFVLGVHTQEEMATPAELDGSEVWAVNALHGIRMVTQWHGVTQLAEKPGRIGLWREHLRALRSPIGEAN